MKDLEAVLEDMKKEYIEYSKFMQLGPSATLVRIAFKQGYLKGMKDKGIPSADEYEYLKRL